MSKTITLTDDQLSVLHALLFQLFDGDKKGGKLTLSSEQYTALYWSGQSSRRLGRLYHVNHNHFNRVWASMGLDTELLPNRRPKYAPV